MHLYAVRLTENKEAVGFFFVRNKVELIDAVDAVTETNACEVQKITKPFSFVWDEKGAPIFGEEFPDDEGERFEEYAKELRDKLGFDDGVFDFLCQNARVKPWTLMADVIEEAL